MKKLLLSLILFFTVTTIQAVTLTVVATSLQNNKGVVQFSLYNKDGTIPDKELNKYYKMQRSSINNMKAKAVFSNLPKGRYAVSIFHDENNNHKIDKGFLTPKEGVGLSNFKSINLFYLPNFKKASFLLEDNKKIEINTIYF